MTSELHKWIVIESDAGNEDWGQYTYRMKVPGGWIYRYYQWAVDDIRDEFPATTRLVSLVFVPQPKEEDNVQDTAD